MLRNLYVIILEGVVQKTLRDGGIGINWTSSYYSVARTITEGHRWRRMGTILRAGMFLHATASHFPALEKKKKTTKRQWRIDPALTNRRGKYIKHWACLRVGRLDDGEGMKRGGGRGGGNGGKGL